MPTIESFTQNPQTFLIALVLGIIPSVLWLFFWLREDRDHPEPIGLIALTFFVGMISVIFVLPIEKLISAIPIFNDVTKTILWSVSEELIKFCAFAVIIWNSSYLDEPLDYPIYFITAALGFAAFENTLFIMHPLAINDTNVSLITSAMRFLGATLLHSSSSSLIGIGIGLAFFKSSFEKFWYGFFGLISAVALHSVFNFFIIQKNGENFLQVFGFLWVVTIIIMLLFEKLRRMSHYVHT